MMRYSVILFDLDGTILNTLDDLAASTNRVLAKTVCRRAVQRKCAALSATASGC